MPRAIVDMLIEKSPEPVDRNWLVRRLDYASYIWAERRLLYLETPKAACSTIKACLAALAAPQRSPLPLTAIHKRALHPLPSLTTASFAEAEAALTLPDWRRVCVVRNPYARLHSAWAEKIRQLSGQFRPLVAQILAADPSAAENNSVSFAGFLRYVRAADLPRVREDPHWAPMTKLLMPQRIAYTHTLRLEDFPRAFAGLLAEIAPEAEAGALLAASRHNASLPADWRGAYDADSAAAARELAGPDFDSFGYDPQSWRETRRAPLERDRYEAAALAVVQERNAQIAELAARVEALEKNLRESRIWPRWTRAAAAPWLTFVSVDSAQAAALPGDPWRLGGLCVVDDDGPDDLELRIELEGGETISAHWGQDSPVAGERHRGAGNSRRARWSGEGAGSSPVALVLAGAGVKLEVLTIEAPARGAGEA